MEYKYSSVIDSSKYDTQGLCDGIDLRRHVAGDLEEVGAFRVQEDWRRLVGPLEKPFKGGLGPDISFITCAVPECLPDRLEICSVGLEFGFIHDDEIDKNIHDASLDEMEQALEQGGWTGKIEAKGASGRRKIAAQILGEMMAIDPERAMEEEDETKELLTPALITASLTNDLFSFEKERDDVNVQNAVLVVMREHGCSEAEARDTLKDRIRIEVANYVRVVEETRRRTDLSDDVKRYIEVMQYTLSGNVAWSTQCPRCNAGAKWNELQLLRAKYGVEKYPATWPSLSSEAERKEPHINGNGVGHHESTKINGHKRKRTGESTGDEMRMNGTNGVKTSARILQPGNDSLVLGHVMSLAVNRDLADLSDNVAIYSLNFELQLTEGYQVVLEPYRYLTSLPSKGFRDQAIDSLNTWLKVPTKSANMIKKVIKMLHSASLMFDDLEDSSPLRRGKLSTHHIYGAAQTINSATYQYTKATGMAAQLSNPSCFRIFIEEIQQLYVGQSYDLYWTHNAVCPSLSEYLKMVDKKTGGLFRMLTRLMVAESPVGDKVSEDDLNLFSCLIGRFFRIRDDYQNLASADYAKQKGFSEDLDEGNCGAFLMKRRSEAKLSHEAKREVLAIMKKTKSLDYTLRVLGELHGELSKEVENLEGKFGEANFALQMMLEMLKL
ncbi:MAG: hypothetical protein Q9183_000583 [Haloplaca sp. 2 TL-2023]